MPLMACKLLTNTAQFKYWFTRSCFPLKPTANTAERKGVRVEKKMHRRPILNNCECHDQDLTLLGSRPTTITIQITAQTYYSCDPNILPLQLDPQLLLSSHTTITT